MSTLRLALSAVAVVALAGGYAGSQAAALRGPEAAAEWHRRVDGPPVRALAALLAASALVLSFVREKEEREEG